MTGPPVHNSHQNPDYPMVESHGSTCDFILAFLDLSNQIIGLTGMYWFRHQFHSTESNIPASIEDMYALFHNSNCSFPFMGTVCACWSQLWFRTYHLRLPISQIVKAYFSQLCVISTCYFICDLSGDFTYLANRSVSGCYWVHRHIEHIWISSCTKSHEM